MARREIQDNMRLPSSTVYEIISRGGYQELKRSFQALSWSAVTAGICMTFSVLCEAFIKQNLPETDYAFLIENMGYTVGFLIVILGRFQLFTENTITVILPLLENFNFKQLLKTMRLWGIVLLFNLIGTFIIALLFTHFNFFSDGILETMLEISKHAVAGSMTDIFVQSIPAGFLIAMLVWLMASVKRSEFLIIFLITYIIAIGDFCHIIAGSVEVFLLLINSMVSYEQALIYLSMACLGNIVGGTGLFTLMAYAQVREEI